MIELRDLKIDRIHHAFSPASEIQEPHLFVGRSEQIELGLSSLMTPGGFLSIYGLRGVGKSSIALQLAKIAQGNVELPKLLKLERFLPSKSFDYIVHYVRCDGFVKSVPDLLKRILFGDEHNQPLFNLTHSGDKHLTELKRIVGVEGSGGAFGIKFGGKGSEERKYETFVSDDVIQQFRALLGAIRKDNQSKTGLLIFIDEFDTLAQKDGFASLVKACSSDFVKFAVVGIAATMAELIKDHSSIGRQIDSVRVPFMPARELEHIITKAEFEVSKAITFDAVAKETISQMSEGFPYFTHLLGKEAMLMAFKRSSPRVDKLYIEDLMAKIAEGRLNTIYESTYHDAVKNSPQRELLLKIFAEASGEDEIFSEPVYALSKELNVSNPSQLMSILTTPLGGAPVLTKVREKYYRFTDPVFRTYARLRNWKFDG